MTKPKVQPPAPAPRSKNELGYINIRVSRKVYNEIMKRAVADRRTLIAQLEIILGV